MFFTKNPNGAWQYGYSATKSLAPGEFRVNTYTEKQGTVGFWHPLTNNGPGAGYYPYVAANTTNETQLGSQKGWAVRAGQAAMEGSNIGQYSLVRFTVPQSGQYRISAQFEGIHFGLSTTDVHVLRNAESLFDADIEGYGGDPGFPQDRRRSPHCFIHPRGRVDGWRHRHIRRRLREKPDALWRHHRAHREDQVAKLTNTLCRTL